MEKGQRIVIEGHDGTGKSSQVGYIREKLLTEYGIKSIEFHEPAGTQMADEIRTLLKNGNIRRDPETDVWLFSAARCDIQKKIGKKALENGLWTVSARNHISTLAYQGKGDGVDSNFITSITHAATSNDYIAPKGLFESNISIIRSNEDTQMAGELFNLIADNKIERDPLTELFLSCAAVNEISKKIGNKAITDQMLARILQNESPEQESSYMFPNFLFVLNLNKEERLRRIANRGQLEVPDNFESKSDDSIERTQNGYLEIAKSLDATIISADPTMDIIANDIFSYISKSLNRH